MKYTIEGFKQEKAVELGLSLTDLLVLRWMADFFPTGRAIKYQIKSKMFFCVNYDKLLSDLPLLGIKKDTLYRRLKLLVGAGVLEHETLKNDEGTFSLYRFGNMYEKLLPYEPDEQPEEERKKPQKKPSGKKSYATVLKDPENVKISEALSKYLSFCRGINYTPKVSTVEKFAETLRVDGNNNPVIAMRIVQQSIDKGWKALYPLKDKQIGGVVSVPSREEDQARNEDGEPIVF